MSSLALGGFSVFSILGPSKLEILDLKWIQSIMKTKHRYHCTTWLPFHWTNFFPEVMQKS